jgi:hypothetical protein
MIFSKSVGISYASDGPGISRLSGTALDKGPECDAVIVMGTILI